MLVIASALGVFQIVTRFVLEQPAEWSEILIRISLIWMVFMGIPMAFRQGAMVSVDVLYRWSPPRKIRVLDVVVCLAALTLIGVIVWWGWDYAMRGSVQSMAGLESVSMFWAYLALPVGGCSVWWASGQPCRSATQAARTGDRELDTAQWGAASTRSAEPTSIMITTMVLCFALTVSVAVSIGLASILGIQAWRTPTC
jgi:TRAP-type C4-dicarboxylate transport system permease small subunit